MTDIGKYLDFVLTLLFAFGVAFEVPVATILLIWSGVVSPDALRAKRPYVIVGAFVIGMLLTPPDVISQTLLALPMWMLFEAGILFSRYFVPQDKVKEASGESEKSDYQPMSEDEMEAELDRIEEEERRQGDEPKKPS